MKNFTPKVKEILHYYPVLAVLLLLIISNNEANAQFTLPTNTAPSTMFDTWDYPSDLISDAVDPQNPDNPVYLLDPAHFRTANIVSPAIPLTTTVSNVKLTVSYKTQSVTGQSSNQVWIYYHLSDTPVERSTIIWPLIGSTATSQPGNVYPYTDRWMNISGTLDINFTAGQYLYVMISSTTGFQFYLDDITISASAGGTTLPIDFEEQLNAKINSYNNAIDLRWATATETNNKGFDVERSQDGATTWNQLDFIASKAPNNNSSSTIHYSYTDAHPLNGNNIYRLKQTDLDGNISYSSITSQEFGVADKLPTIFPNPVSGSVLRIKNAPGNGSYKIIDVNGRTISTGKFADSKDISVQNLSAGIYFIQLNDQSGTRRTLKFIKQ